MPSRSTKKQTDIPQFSLKHRLIGAGILISFGVIILPWMLGSYSSDKPTLSAAEQDPDVKPSSIATLATKAASKSVNSEGDQDASNQSAEGEDKEVSVFISRVQPLNSEEEKPLIDDSSNSETQSQVAASVESKKPEATAEKAPEAEQKKEVVKQPEKTTPKKEVVEKSEPKAVPVESTKPTNSDVDRGYIVSIGVYGDTSNVDKMVADLKSKNFQPVVRKEKFNQKDVTRVFLGPFETRADAGKINLDLKAKGINKTLIKEFP